ncbi:unnamed protein product [Dicrocoelium dendriticum]|nr:unnamed protein product [Dicrocoelium dendriticum]
MDLRIREMLSPLKPTHLDIQDFSDSCGIKLDIFVVSEAFEKMPILERHRRNSLYSCNDFESLDTGSMEIVS